MSGTLVALNILQLFTLPTVAEINNDFTTVNGHQNRLLKKLFDYKTYDSTRSSHEPIDVDAFLIIDHVENIDEVAQTLTFHGSLILTWQDKRLVWDARDFGNISSTLINFYISNIWTPSVYFRTLIRATTKVIQYYNSEITVNSTGFVSCISSVSVMTECRFDYTNYPFENQTCAVMLVSPMSNAQKLVFTRTPIMISRNDLFDYGKNNMTSGANFDVIGMKAERYFYYPGGITKNQSSTILNAFTSTILRFELQLKRNAGHYLSMVALPLFASSIAAYVAVCMSKSAVSLIWIAACLIMQAINCYRIVENLPPDYNVTPFCAKMTTVIFLETFLLFFYRFCMVVGYSRFEEDRIQKMHQMEHLIVAILAVSGILNFWLLIF